jgi:hypothetical protein
MIKQTCRLKTISLLLACGSIAVFFGQKAMAQSAYAPIVVKINGKSVDFGGQQPQKINGYVMIPLRSVGEDLGATILFNPESKTIEASRQGSDIILKIGDSTAYINHAPITLSQPAIVSGTTTLVPLRFIAQAFGARVKWDSASNSVDIFSRSRSKRNVLTASDVRPREQTSNPPASSDKLVTETGAIGSVDTRVKPMQITLLINGQKHLIDLSESCVVLVRRGNEAAIQSNIWALRPGDIARVQMLSQNGPATGIQIAYDETSGIVARIDTQKDGSHTVIFADGKNVQLIPGSGLSNGRRRISWNDVKPGDPVVIRLDQEVHTGYALRIGHQFVSAKTPSAPITSTPEPEPESNTQQPPAQTGVPVIRSIRLENTEILKAGDEAIISMRATRGGTASITIPGVSSDIPMTETTPGVYRAAYVVPAGLSVENANIIGSIATSNGKAASVKAPETLTIQSKFPIIQIAEPVPDGVFASSHPVIAASFSEVGGAKIAPATARIIVDDNDLTSSAAVTRRTMSLILKSRLSAGLHRVHFSICDTAGNRAASEWSFVIDPHSPIVSSLAIDAPMLEPVVKVGQTMHITLNAQQGGSASFSILGVVSQVPMKESAPGVYVGQFTPAPGQSERQAALVAQYVSKNGASATIGLDRFVEIDAERPTAPTISFPKNGEEVVDIVSLQGEAAPGAIVSIDIKYRSPGLADLYQVSGKSAASQVQADSEGRWETEPLRLKSGGNLGTTKGTTYTATVVVSDSNGAQSLPAVVSFKSK